MRTTHYFFWTQHDPNSCGVNSKTFLLMEQRSASKFLTKRVGAHVNMMILIIITSGGEIKEFFEAPIYYAESSWLSFCIFSWVTKQRTM